MSSGVKLSRSEVLPTVERFVASIEDVCERVELAGSLRRGCDYVSDIEVVAIARKSGLFDGLGESLLDARLATFVKQHRLQRFKNGDRFKQFQLVLPCRLSIKLDLFITDAERWPVIFTIRTGPAAFSQSLVTDRTRGGLLRAGLNVRDGFVWDRGERVAVSDEREFLELAGGWVEPGERR